MAFLSRTTQTMRSWSDRIKRYTTDGISLCGSLLLRRHRRSLRDVLVSEARGGGREGRPPNVVATSAMWADGELGKIQYYGLAHYIASLSSSTFASTSTSTLATTSTSLNRDDGPTPEPTKIKSIPFMVTASQRSRLADMGYSKDALRSMRPLEAVLILEHNVRPSTSRVTVDRLVAKYMAEQEGTSTDSRLKESDANTENSARSATDAEALTSKERTDTYGHEGHGTPTSLTIVEDSTIRDDKDDGRTKNVTAIVNAKLESETQTELITTNALKVVKEGESYDYSK